MGTPRARSAFAVARGSAPRGAPTYPALAVRHRPEDEGALRDGLVPRNPDRQSVAAAHRLPLSMNRASASMSPSARVPRSRATCRSRAASARIVPVAGRLQEGQPHRRAGARQPRHVPPARAEIVPGEAGLVQHGGQRAGEQLREVAGPGHGAVVPVGGGGPGAPAEHAPEGVGPLQRGVAARGPFGRTEPHIGSLVEIGARRRVPGPLRPAHRMGADECGTATRGISRRGDHRDLQAGNIGREGRAGPGPGGAANQRCRDIEGSGEDHRGPRQFAVFEAIRQRDPVPSGERGALVGRGRCRRCGPRVPAAPVP